ncbi:MAG: transposase [Candidatus Shapirobacteria bacterium]
MPVDDPSIFADKFRIASSRLNNWDYSTPGLYYVTICTLNHNKFFGKIENGKIVLSAKGQIAKEELLKTEVIRPNIKIDSWVIMPNHIHLIVQIKKVNKNIQISCRDVARYVSTENKQMSTISPKPNSLSSIIRSFKSAVTKQCREQHFFFAWQSRFYDHIIHDESEYCKIKQYIVNNPNNWLKDPYHL